ncbi:MAG TPA: metallophosphoesterase [Desulfuromonadaceae bacterium]
MSLFLITFLSLYGGMHAYAFIRLAGAFSPSPQASFALAAWMILMVAAPVLVRLAEGAGLERVALFVAWPGYVWMGVLFLFASALAALDGVRAVAWLVSRVSGSGMSGFLTATGTCGVALIVAILASAYGLYDARRIRTETVTITTPKLPPTVPRIRIVQISDVHMGLLFGEARLNAILAAVRAAAPDILVSTGDLVDGRLSREDVISRQNRLAYLLAALPAPQGKFAVTGNHEYYAGLEQALAFTRTAGFTLLRGQTVSLPCGIAISGVDDPAGSPRGVPEPAPSEQQLLRAVPDACFRLLLKHRPVVPAGIDGLFDLQLSGHVHQGQIFPFNLLVRLQYPIPCGTTATGGHSLIHVSRGTGTWGPPLRVLAPPEVTVIDIVRAK